MMRALVLAAAGILAAVPASAQDWPSKPVRIVVPFAPGGATDVVTRIFAQRFQESFGQTFLVENRGGAGGLLGSQVVSKAAPDGYAFVMGTTGTHAVNATLYEKTGFNPLREFAAVSRAALLPNMIVAHPALPARTVKELIALAAQGAEAVADTPEAFAAIMRSDVTRWGEIVRRTGARAD